MKKIVALLLASCVPCALQARTVDVSTSFAGASHFEQVQASATAALALNVLAGVEAKWSNERAFKDPVYSLAAPLSFDFDFVRLVVRPFYYLKNKSDNAAFQDANAFGLNGQMRVSLKSDEVDDSYAYAFFGAAFARQQGTVFYNNGSLDNRYYSQAAYSLGLSQIFFNTYGFDVEATAFQYPDGIKDVVGLRSVLDQQDLAHTQTLDVVHQLTKYTVGGRFTRIWSDKGSSIYGSYRYGEYHDTDAEHSIMVGNTFVLAERLSFDIAYNHVRSVHNENHRDIFYIQLSTFF